MNGVQDIGERGVAAVPIQLLAGCTGTTVVATKNSNANGEFTFADLAAGSYRLQITLPVGFAVTLQDAIADEDYDSDYASNTESSCVTLAGGEENYRIDAGITTNPVPTATPTITPTPLPPTATPTPTNTPTPVGQRQPLPVVVRRFWGIGSGMMSMSMVYKIAVNAVWPAVTVELLVGCTGSTVIATKNTNANGDYTFSNLPDDQYRLRIIPPSGYTVTLKDAIPDDDYDSDLNNTAISDCIPLGTAEENYRVDGGITTDPVPTPTNTCANANSHRGTSYLCRQSYQQWQL